MTEMQKFSDVPHISAVMVDKEGEDGFFTPHGDPRALKWSIEWMRRCLHGKRIEGDLELKVILKKVGFSCPDKHLAHMTVGFFAGGVVKVVFDNQDFANASMTKIGEIAADPARLDTLVGMVPGTESKTSQ